MTKAKDETRLVEWLVTLNGQEIEVELVSGTTLRGELSIMGAKSDHIRLKVAGHGEEIDTIPLTAIARAKPIPQKKKTAPVDPRNPFAPTGAHKIKW